MNWDHSELNYNDVQHSILSPALAGDHSSVLQLRKYWADWQHALSAKAMLQSECSGKTLFRLPDSSMTLWTKDWFLWRSTDWNKGSTSENAQDSSWCWLGVFKVSGKVCVRRQSQSAPVCSVSHTTILPVTTRAVNVRNQTSQESITSSRPLCDSSCYVAHKPQNIKSAQPRQTKTFQDYVRANFKNCPTISSSSFLNWWCELRVVGHSTRRSAQPRSCAFGGIPDSRPVQWVLCGRRQREWCKP